LGEGDVLRKAMGKKDRQEMERQREKFLLGAKEKQISEEIAISIFDKIEKFASYGFNKSHATAYGYITYVTAYLKAHFPHEWMASLMTCDQGDLSKVSKFIWECRSLKIPILPPDINEADKDFVPTLKGIRFAMAGIKGLGTAVVEAVLKERKNHGPFLSLYDFIQRIDISRVGKKNIEIFIDAGAFDFTKWSRDALKESVEPMFDEVSREKKDEVHGILNFFSLIEPQEKKTFMPPEVYKKSTLLEILQREKELLGFYLTSHPMDSYQNVLQRLSCVPLKEIHQLEHDRVFRSAFLVEDITLKISNKNQKKFAILEISDGEEKFELPIWTEMYENKQQLLQKNKLLYAILQIDRREDSVKLQCRWLEDLTLVNEEVLQSCDTAYDAYKNQVQNLKKKNAKTQESLEKSLGKGGKIEEKKKEIIEKQPSVISMKVHADKVRFSEILQLKNLFRQNPGKTKVELQFVSQNKNVGAVLIDATWGVRVHEELTKEIKEIKSVMSLSVNL
jgi:DNA polymerase-3 subunit alpha